MEQDKYKRSPSSLQDSIRHGGRDQNGPTVWVWPIFHKELGLPCHPAMVNLHRRWYQESDTSVRGLLKIGKAVDINTESLEPLDLVFFRIGGAITHAGVMVDRHSFLHVMIGQQVHITPLNPSWRRRLRGARRLT